VSEAPAVAR